MKKVTLNDIKAGTRIYFRVYLNVWDEYEVVSLNYKTHIQEYVGRIISLPIKPISKSAGYKKFAALIENENGDIILNDSLIIKI